MTISYFHIHPIRLWPLSCCKCSGRVKTLVTTQRSMIFLLPLSPFSSFFSESKHPSNTEVDSHSVSLLQEMKQRYSPEELAKLISQNSEANSSSSKEPLQTLSCTLDKDLDRCIMAAKKDAQIRKRITQDNGWLWMQVTQLKTQMEGNFEPAPHGEESRCILSWQTDVKERSHAFSTLLSFLYFSLPPSPIWYLSSSFYPAGR